MPSIVPVSARVGATPCPRSGKSSIGHGRSNGRSSEEVDTPSGQAIHRANDLDLAVLFQASQHIAALTYRADGQAHIGLSHLVNKFTVLAGALALVMRCVYRRF